MKRLYVLSLSLAVVIVLSAFGAIAAMEQGDFYRIVKGGVTSLVPSFPIEQATLNNPTIVGQTLSGATFTGTITNSGTISGGTISGATISGSTFNTTSVNLTGQTTNLGPTSIVGALGHTYLVQVYANQTVIGAAGSTTVNISWTDSQGAKNANVGTMSNTTVSAIVQANTVVFGANATNINYTVSGVNGNTYDLHIRVTDWN